MVKFFSRHLPRLPHHTLFAGSLACLLCVGALPAQAQTVFSGRPVVMVVPQAAGRANDIIGRVMGRKLGEVMGGSVVVENRPGAGGNTGTQAVARVPKEGYTLLMSIRSSQANNSALYKTPGFDAVIEFRHVSLIGAVLSVLLLNPSFPTKNVAELLALDKAKPGHYSKRPLVTAR